MEFIAKVQANGKAYVKFEKKLPQQDQEGNDELQENDGNTGYRVVKEDGSKLMQVTHESVNVGESIAQIKRSTSATVTSRGTILVSQFKQEIASRGEDVYFFKNALGTFEGSLAEAQKAFPDVNFSDVNIPDPINRSNPEFSNLQLESIQQPLTWKTKPEWNYDAEEHGGKPTDWNKWADATQTALDAIGMIPAVGIFADCLNGVVSLTRGNYGDAALSFFSAIPGLGLLGGAIKIGSKATKKAKKIDAVYDLVLKKGDDVKGYVGQSKDFFTRMRQHFNPKRGKFKDWDVIETQSTIHKFVAKNEEKVTKYEKEMYEQFLILEKYRGQITKRGSSTLNTLLNKVMPVGGRFNLKTPQGRKLFKEEAIKIAEKYKLPTKFDPPNF